MNSPLLFLVSMLTAIGFAAKYSDDLGIDTSESLEVTVGSQTFACSRKTLSETFTCTETTSVYNREARLRTH